VVEGNGWFKGSEMGRKNKIKCSKIRNSNQKDRSQWKEQRKATRLKGRKRRVNSLTRADLRGL
jgi:hypothetical protein